LVRFGYILIEKKVKEKLILAYISQDPLKMKLKFQYFIKEKEKEKLSSKLKESDFNLNN